MPLLTLSSISVYRRGEGPSNGDPDAEPVLRMEFPVDPAGNHTFLRSVVEANRRLYNSAALGVAVTGAGKEFSCMEKVFIIIRLLFFSGAIVLLLLVLICWWHNRRQASRRQVTHPN